MRSPSRRRFANGRFGWTRRSIGSVSNSRQIVSNPACGDILRLAARFEGGVAVEVRYKVRGCTASIAAGSALTQWITGKTREQLAQFRPAVVDEAVGGLAAESKHAAVRHGFQS